MLFKYSTELILCTSKDTSELVIVFSAMVGESGAGKSKDERAGATAGVISATEEVNTELEAVTFRVIKETS